jgi:hypothetical protein
MLNHTEVSMSMQRYINNSVDYMRRHGFILPTLMIMNKGKMLFIDIKHKYVYDIAGNKEEEEGFFPDVSSDAINEVGIAFRLDDGYKDRYLVEVACKIAKKYKPDAIGAISACLFKEYSTEEFSKNKVGHIQRDPEAVRVLYSTYYLKDSPEPKYMVLPYTMRDIEDPVFGNENNYTVNVIPSSWKSWTGEIQHILPCPYK